MAFYVVFEGSMSGVFDSCTQCCKAVDGGDGKYFERYETYDEAVTAWEIHCEVHGYGKDYFQARLLHPKRLIHRNDERMSANNLLNTTVTTTHSGQEATSHMADATVFHENHAVERQDITESTDWMIQYNMQQQLEVMCHYLSTPPAVYVRDYLRVRKGIPYFRYKVTVALNGVLQEPFKCYGKFSRSEDDAKEDSTCVGLRWLLKLTGQKIRDFNYYNTRELEQKKKLVHYENIKLSTVNRMLKDQLDLLQNEQRARN